MNTNRDNENLDFYRGDTGFHEFKLKNDEGEPYNLTGFAVRSQARLTPDAETAIFDVTITDGQNGNSFSTGLIYLLVPPSVTKDMPPQCHYDIQAISGSLTITLAKGMINTPADVTRV